MLITKSALFSCFDNFVPGDKYGTPSFCPTHKALKHLRELLFCCLEHVKTLKMGEVSIKEKTIIYKKFINRLHIDFIQL